VVRHHVVRTRQTMGAMAWRATARPGVCAALPLHRVQAAGGRFRGQQTPQGHVAPRL